MVFESIVAELLNKVIGEYIENLDYSQLKLSLWGGKNAQNNFVFYLATAFCITISLFSGDLVLNDLLIKESALDVLDLPVRLEYGRLGIKFVIYTYNYM
jgi:vacuolar protein sorting-associated protein 13A/C